ncbi:MAG TPA: hypothetical protein PK344_14895 [Syntrophorhabdaceae bacterium]|jgi:hypothetical protein|nr:hypothetical protein [Syntrophorhabdaceae bacterium]HQJ31161.1 hypothetical protein [Syntrophales bacterium]
MNKYKFSFQVPGKGTWTRTYAVPERKELQEMAEVLSRITRLTCVSIEKVGSDMPRPEMRAEHLSNLRSLRATVAGRLNKKEAVSH